jgi:hypothetical protein
MGVNLENLEEEMNELEEDYKIQKEYCTQLTRENEHFESSYEYAYELLSKLEAKKEMIEKIQELGIKPATKNKTTKI